MNWFKRMVINWVREDWDNARQEQDCYPSPKLSRGLNSVGSTRDIGSDVSLQFKVYNAIGGKIVEFSRYDPKTDRHDRQIYIVSKDEDFGEKIAKISTLEVLR